MDEWIKKIQYRYTMKHYSVIKNEEILYNMVGPVGHCAKWSKLEKDKYHVILFVCMILANKNPQTCRKRDQICVTGMGEIGGR